jgi:hypothetical protein
VRRGAWGGTSSRGGVRLRRGLPLPAAEACPECGLPLLLLPREEGGFLVPGERVLRCEGGHARGPA